MSDGPLVSVVLATSRDSPYLPEAIASVRAQTREEWELVVVDDGSPEPAVIDSRVGEVAGARVLHQRRSGPAAARNAGLLAARGTFVTFLDDDDYWPEDRLERQLDALDAQPEHVGCYGRLRYVDEAGVDFGEGPDCSAPAAALAAGFHLGTVMVRRDALSRIGLFDPSLRVAEDLDFSLRLGRAGPLAYIPHVLLYYRRHSANTTSAASPEHHRVGREVYEHRYRLARLGGENAAAAAIVRSVRGESYVARAALRSAKAQLGSGDGRGAARQLRDAASSGRVLARSMWRRTVDRARPPR